MQELKYSNEELKKAAEEFYKLWYDTEHENEISNLERKAVIHAFIGGCAFILKNKIIT